MVDKSQPVKGIAHRPVADAPSSSTDTTNRCAVPKAEVSGTAVSETAVHESRDSISVSTKTEPTQLSQQDPRPKEHGGQKGLEPTRYGDWEKNGRCTDF